MKKKLQKMSMAVATVVLFVSVMLLSVEKSEVGYWEIATSSSFAEDPSEYSQVDTIRSTWQEVFYFSGGFCQVITHREVYINCIGMGTLSCLSGTLFKDFIVGDFVICPDSDL